MKKMKFRTGYLNDPSLWLLVASNLITAFFAVKDGWSTLTIVWIYWAQSVTIGIFTSLKILSSKTPVAKEAGNNRFAAIFFLFHYGFIHFVYGAFLFTPFFGGSMDKEAVIIASSLFFVNHLFSFLYNRAREKGALSYDDIVGNAYYRIIPTCLTVMFIPFSLMIIAFVFPSEISSGSAMKIILLVQMIFFLLLKTLVDAAAHVAEHSKARKAADDTEDMVVHAQENR